MNTKLKRIVDYAYENVPYFNHIINTNNIDIDEIYDERDIVILPTFSKNTIMEIGYPNFVSGECLDESNRLKLSPDFRIEKTTGTTMKRMIVPWNTKDFMYSAYHHWKYRYITGDILPNSKQLNEKRIEDKNIPYKDDIPDVLSISINGLSEKNMFSSLCKIQEFKPVWIYMTPGVLYLLLRYAFKHEIEFPDTIRYVELIGEPVLKNYKTYIEDFLGVTIADMYGTVETNGIAYRCENGNFHILSENVIVEILKDGQAVGEGELGNVCVTGLYNTYMPMLRYELNDFAIKRPYHFCNCGNPEDVLELSTARLTSILILDDESIFSDACLYFPLSKVVSLVTVKPHDICFHMHYKTIRTYAVTFEIGNHRIERCMLERIFVNCLYSYGLGNILFEFDYSEGVQHNGILRIAGDSCGG